ncbi:MAG: hypothetical protein ACREDK_01880 [Thermoplasmata archaeon]
MGHSVGHSGSPSHAPAMDHRGVRAAIEVQHLPPHWEPTPYRPRLPFGIALLAILVVIGGAVVLVAGALYLLNAYVANAVPPSLLIIQTVDALGAAILILFGAVLIAVGNALWHQETWSLWTTIVVVFAGLTYLFFTASITVLFIFLLVIFVYLLTVRRYFY